MDLKITRRVRWAVPAAAVAVTAAVIGGLQVPSASAAPVLPPRTAAQLLASVGTDAAVPPFTGAVTESASLGLPQLSGSGGGQDSLASLLTGSHTVQVYYQDPTRFRLSLPQPQAETDVVADGSKLWLWQSAADAVTEVVPGAGGLAHAQRTLPAGAPLTPQQAASQAVKAVGATTLVSVTSNVTVAGQPAYQLVLAPKDSRSLVGRIVIAVDAKYGMPLRVQLYARGASGPAFQTGYTALSFGSPSASNFTFTPPAGSSVHVVKAGSGGSGAAAGAPAAASGAGTYGSGWLTVAAFPESDLTQATRSGQNAYSAGGQGVTVSPGELVKGLLASGKPVHGSWGSGTLVTTSLVSLLIVNGEVYAGAVAPSVLYAAVGHTS